MNKTDSKTMRDALIEQVYNAMGSNNRIFFLSADMVLLRLINSGGTLVTDL